MFFGALVKESRLAQLVDFENRAGLFPAVDSRMKFCLLTVGRNEGSARFAFFLTDPAQLAEPERNFILTPEQIAAINPNTRTAPVFRSRADAALAAKIYANAPVLIEESKGPAGNPWGIKFRQGLFNMTSDSGLFRTASQLSEAGFIREGTDWVRSGAGPIGDALAVEEAGVTNPRVVSQTLRAERYVPLYEGKMIHQFDHRWASYDEEGETLTEVDLVGKRDPNFEPVPRYWVRKNEGCERLAAKGWFRSWVMGWRRNARNTDERTMISTVFPSTVGVGDSAFLLNAESDSTSLAGLFANANSVILDFVARQKVGGINMSFYFISQFPFLAPHFYSTPRLSFLRPKILELTYTSCELAPFALDLGYDGPPFAWDEERRAHLRAGLDAFYARAYGVTRDELRYILDPADVVGSEYPSETFRVLKEREIRQHGEYRTGRLVLAAWDRLETSGEFRELGL